MKPQIPDVLAQRYASTTMCELWSATGKIRLEREFWIAVMKAQQAVGVEISDAAIGAYEQVKDQIDLERIAERERVLRHDVKARIEEFCELAGEQQIHKGLTSRDLTDNVEQLQILRSLALLEDKYIAVLYQLARWAERTRDWLLVARTHNVPAQPTTLGKRLAMFGEEMLQALQRLQSLRAGYPLRGLQGAVGTQLDQHILLQDPKKVRELEAAVCQHLGGSAQLQAVGQVYPRSLDTEVVHCLFGLSAGISSLAKTLRLMAGQGLFTEGFQSGQVGSSAMPHKVNARNAERITGLHQVLNGYVNMLMGLSGDQWNEGDVACSVVRRVALPGAFWAFDGQLETMLTILQEMGFYEDLIRREVDQQLPFLATTTILMAAVRKGGGREQLHDCIKQHALQVAEELRSGIRSENNLLQRLAEDPALPLDLPELQLLLIDSERLVGSAPEQVNTFLKRVARLVFEHPNTQAFLSFFAGTPQTLGFIQVGTPNFGRIQRCNTTQKMTKPSNPRKSMFSSKRILIKHYNIQINLILPA